MSRMRSTPSRSLCRSESKCAPRLALLLLLIVGAHSSAAQENVADQVKQLTDAMNRVQAQLDASQKQLEELRRQLAALQGQTASAASQPASPDPESDGAALAARVEDLRERQGVQESQIAVQEQTKVESESKFPVKVSGLVLLNAFVNTRGVDMVGAPTLAVPGGGSTDLSLRQTILGLDMRGPHLLGARSHGDLRVDFAGSAQPASSYLGGYGWGLLRLRTAHAALDWKQTEAFFALDRPLVSPLTPDSLTSLAEPALAWSGNLWSWNPQVGVTRDFSFGSTSRARAQAALIDVGDAPYTASLIAANGAIPGPSSAENSRWPGVEARLAFPGGEAEHGMQFGVGGVYAPHRTPGGRRFDTWASTLDLKLPLPARMQVSGGFYRGAGLGGLGGGGYKDYVYRMYEGIAYFRTLDDVGGWAQWKQRVGERLELNEALGIDNVPASQLRFYAGGPAATYQNLARNRTVTGNVIYSPSAYLLFSLEYRRLESSPVNGSTAASDVIGVAAGYKF